MLGEAIQKALAHANEADSAHTERKMVSDDHVAACLEKLVEGGYITSEQIVEPVRAFLSGYGILLAGDTGVGKTFLMRSLGVKCYDVKELTAYKASGIQIWYDSTDLYEVCIDDLGTEEVSSDYGVKTELMSRVIAHRCELPVNTHITTNLPPTSTGENQGKDSIRRRYEDRTFNRILGMCKPFKMSGDSRRRAVATTQTSEDDRRAALMSVQGCQGVMRYVELMQQAKASGDQQELAVLRAEIVGELSQNGLDAVERATG